MNTITIKVLLLVVVFRPWESLAYLARYSRAITIYADLQFLYNDYDTKKNYHCIVGLMKAKQTFSEALPNENNGPKTI